MIYNFKHIEKERPEHFQSILADNGDRYAVVYRGSDEKYYVEQDGRQFFPQYWCELPKDR